MIGNILNVREKLEELSSEEQKRLIEEYRSFLIESPKDFNHLYKALESIPAEPMRETYNFDDATSLELNRVAKEVKVKGISIWQNFYPKDKIFELKNLANICLNKTERWLHTRDREFSTEEDVELGCEFLGSQESLINGRIRTRFVSKRTQHNNSLVNQLFGDLRINQVGRLLYGAHAFKSYFLFERLQPSSVSDCWHIDGILDQYKAMILLEDVGEASGPMFFKPATKGLLHKELKPLLHTTFAYGRSWGCYPMYKIVDDLGIQTYKGTGRAGDAIFFDTLNIHRGSICKQGHRLGLVSYLGVETAKNQILRLLGVS
jgi:hypothetical protein